MLPRSLLLRVAGVSFFMGAGIEWFMIKVRIGSETFYDTATRLEAQRQFDALKAAKEEVEAEAAASTTAATKTD